MSTLNTVALSDSFEIICSADFITLTLEKSDGDRISLATASTDLAIASTNFTQLL